MGVKTLSIARAKERDLAVDENWALTSLQGQLYLEKCLCAIGSFLFSRFGGMHLLFMVRTTQQECELDFVSPTHH